MAVIGVVSVIAVPQLLTAYERSRQRRSMAEMRAIAGANGSYRVDMGGYASGLGDLAPDYMNPVPPLDAWGTAWVYTANRDSYTLTSLGLDAASGPAPPANWYDEPFEADLVVANGAFTQAPESR